jgi:hypothetical protein
MAFTSPANQGMIKLFQTLPYKVTKKLEDGDLVLSCRFEDVV